MVAPTSCLWLIVIILIDGYSLIKNLILNVGYDDYLLLFSFFSKRNFLNVESRKNVVRWVFLSWVQDIRSASDVILHFGLCLGIDEWHFTPPFHQLNLIIEYITAWVDEESSWRVIFRVSPNVGSESFRIMVWWAIMSQLTKVSSKHGREKVASHCLKKQWPLWRGEMFRLWN